MTDTPNPFTTVRSLTDLVEVVPTLLGFHPAESVVLITVDAGHVLVTARADLDEGSGGDLVTAFSPVWRRFPQANHIVIAFSADAARAWAGLDEVDSALADGVGRILVYADGTHWFDTPHGCATPYDGESSVHVVRAAFAGRRVRRSRAELAALLEPDRTPEEVVGSLERVVARLTTWADILAEATAVLEGHAEIPGGVDLDSATVVSLATHDPAFLHDALISTTTQNAEERRELWLQVVRASVPSAAGGALVALGLAGWLTGDGALQSVCLEALDGRRGPRDWVELLERINAEVMPPSEWDALRMEVALAS